MAFDDVAPLRALRNVVTAIAAWQFAHTGMVPHTLGYNSYKAKAIERAITDARVLQQFTRGKLPSRYGYHIDERIVEYPWAFSRLPAGARRILDAGSTFNYRHVLRTKALAGREITILTLDREGFVSAPQRVSYVYDDLRDLPFRDGRFDAVVCLSTLEHVGLDNSVYTPDPSKKENEPTNYLRAVRELVRVTSPGGRLLLTMPYGRHRNWGWFQVFDATMVNTIIHLVAPREVSETYFKYSGGQWQFATRVECDDCDSYVPGMSAERPSDGLAFSRGIVALCVEV
jgi:SAM-dependent methyltransferase